MKRLLAILSAASICATAAADEQIHDANNLEALTLAVAHVGTDLQSRDAAGAQVDNRVAGPQIAFGYVRSRTPAVFGVSGFNTRVEMGLALGRADFAGAALDPSSGAVVAGNGPFNVQALAARGRLGYGWEFGPGGRLSLAPYLALVQQVSHRGGTVVSGSATSLQNAAEAGLLAQASLAAGWVLGIEAGVGHTIGDWQVDNHNVIEPAARLLPAASLFLDHRTDADGHERIVLRQGVARYGDPAQATGSLEPRRQSSFTIGLEFGTEGDLFEALFH